MSKREQVANELEIVKRRIARLEGFAEEAEIIDDALAMLKAQETRVIRPEEYADWDADAWAEDQEIGCVFALDRTAVPAYIKYIAFDSGSPKRLWTACPTDEQREATPWQT